MLQPQQVLETAASRQGPYKPYACAEHQVNRGRYITSNDSRGFIPVYEYPLNGQWIMMDADDGYILWTGIWKALGNSKADIVRMLEARPDWAPQVRRVRGGYLKIQGTWLPYETALTLSRRVAYPIRHDLIPLFGPGFPDTCLQPGQPGYGQVLPSMAVRRKRRATQPVPDEHQPDHTLAPPHQSSSNPLASAPYSIYATSPYVSSSAPPYAPLPSSNHLTGAGSSYAHALPYNQSYSTGGRPRPLSYPPAPSASPSAARFSPYSLAHYARPTSPPSSSTMRPDASPSSPFRLPPVHTSTGQEHSVALLCGHGTRLPPISAFDAPPPGSALNGAGPGDAAAVLRRLKEDDDMTGGAWRDDDKEPIPGMSGWPTPAAFATQREPSIDSLTAARNLPPPMSMHARVATWPSASHGTAPMPSPFEQSSHPSRRN